MFKNVFVSTDGTAQSNRAVKAAAAIARATGGELTIFHAIAGYKMPYYSEGVAFDWPQETTYLKESGREADKLLAKAKAAAGSGVEVHLVRIHADSTAEAIIKAAKKARADLIVMASHGRRGIEKLLLGSETQKVLARTKRPVMVVR